MLKIAWNKYYAHPLPAGHRFPMEKYDLIPEQLIYEGTINQENFFTPTALSEELIMQIHDKTYWNKLQNGLLTRSEQRKIGFPYSERLIERERMISQGTIDAVDYAKQYGVAMNVAGGTHHAYTDRGEGFCLLNDFALAAIYALAKPDIGKILIIDLDVHQGNGTARIFQENASVFTFSMHGAKNYPLHKEQSDLDVALPDRTDDFHYLEILDQHLPLLFEKVEPDLVFYLSGVDVLATDKLGRLALSLEGCKKRDRKVLELCYRNRTPVVVSMGGGYSEKIGTIVEAHANTFRLAQEIFF